MNQPSTSRTGAHLQDTAPAKPREQETKIDKREQARQEHTNHFTNRAPTNKAESPSNSE